MSFPIKKLLFFMVLFIVCNTAFSNQECINNVHSVFIRGAEPSVYFKFAMTSLSMNVIEEKNTTKKLANHIDDNAATIFMHGGREWYQKHHEVYEYYSSLRSLIGFPNIRDESLKSKKNDISGYYQSLVKRLKEISWNEINFADGPQKYCQQDSKISIYPFCIKFFATLFKRQDDDVIQMDGKEAFIYCYENFTFNDLTVEKIFEDSNEEPQYKKHAVVIMIAYVDYMVEAAYEIVNNMDKLGPNLFPTVEEYCASSRPSSSTA